jgi:hypothetical protein
VEDLRRKLRELRDKYAALSDDGANSKGVCLLGPTVDSPENVWASKAQLEVFDVVNSEFMLTQPKKLKKNRSGSPRLKPLKATATAAMLRPGSPVTARPGTAGGPLNVSAGQRSPQQQQQRPRTSGSAAGSLTISPNQYMGGTHPCPSGGSPLSPLDRSPMSRGGSKGNLAPICG